MLYLCNRVFNSINSNMKKLILSATMAVAMLCMSVGANAQDAKNKGNEKKTEQTCCKKNKGCGQKECDKAKKECKGSACNEAGKQECKEQGKAPCCNSSKKKAADKKMKKEKM